MTTAIFSQIERGLTSVGSISKMAKFGSTASDTISNLFHGSDLARAFGSAAKPLKKFAEFTDLTSFIDPLNGLFASSIAKQWTADKLKFLAKIALIAGLLLTPIGFASSTLGLFSIGALGANIGTVGTMTGFTALKNGLILSSAVYNVYERRTAAFATKQNRESADLLRAKTISKMYDIWNQCKIVGTAPPSEAEMYQFYAYAKELGWIDVDTRQVWDKFGQTSKEEVKAQASHKKHVYHELKYTAEKNKLAATDDINKVALLTIGFIGAFVSAAVPGLAAVGALQLYSAYIGWQKSDAEVLASQAKVAAFNAKRESTVAPKEWLIP